MMEVNGSEEIRESEEYDVEKELKQLLDDIKYTYKDLDVNASRRIEEKFLYQYQSINTSEQKDIIIRSIKCAKSIRGWGFSTSAIIAGLLFVILSTGEMEILPVPKKTKVLFQEAKKTEEEVESSLQGIRDGLESLERMNELVRSEGFFVYLFVLYQRLTEANGLNPEKIDHYISQLELVLNPVLKENKIYGWYYRFETMGNISEKLKRLEQYRDRYYRKNQSFCSKVFECFERLAADEDLSNYSKEINRYSKSFLRPMFENRSPFSILREAELENKSTLDEQVFQQRIQKGNMAFYDITVLFNEFSNSPIEDFIRLYELYFVQHRLWIVKIKKASVSQTPVLIMKDEMGNLYRVFVETESQYMKYFFGNVIDENGGFIFKKDDKSATRICIHLKDENIRCLDIGATVLDAAFALQEEKWGLHFQSAEVNKKTVNMSYKLQEGDHIEIQRDESRVTAEIGWFKYLNTVRAREALIKYFKTEYHLQ